MEKETEFKWTDELVNEFTDFLDRQGVESLQTKKELLLNFKEDKLKPTITNLDYDEKEVNIWFKDGGEPMEISKERLAEILIAESKGELFIDNLEGIKSRQGTYTEKEYLDFGERCFNNARLLQSGMTFTRFRNEELKYKSFSEFMNIKSSEIECAVSVGMVVCDTYESSKYDQNIKRVNEVDLTKGEFLLGGVTLKIDDFLKQVEIGRYKIIEW